MHRPSRDAFVLATGPSMSQEVADSVRGRGLVVAVSDAYKLAPWADMLVSTDLGWWIHHQPAFSGRKVCSQFLPGTVQPQGCRTDLNSGAMAVMALRLYDKPDRIFLLGVDMGGDHFFGRHPEPLRNTAPERWPVFEQQFLKEMAACERAGIQLYNLTPGSNLQCVPKMNLEDV